MKNKNSKKPKKKSLGRGLSALFETDTENKSTVGSAAKEDKSVIGENPILSEKSYRLLPLNRIHPHPHQPRSYFDQDKLEELATSIKNYGIIEPIIVNPKTVSNGETHYEIIAGERRLRAAKLAEISEIPAIIKSPNNDELMEMMLIENLQREDLTPMEEAQSYETIINKKKLTQDQLADLIGKSRSHITNMMRLLKAPLAVKQKLAQNRLSMSQVRTMLGLPDKEMIELAELTEAQSLSVRELEKWVNRFQKKQVKKPAQINTPAKKDPNIAEIESMYRDRLKTKVTISPLKNKKGKVEIEYYDYDELLEILSKFK